ncbi:MAG: ATP-binding protein [Trueperaceae bacterium]|nr:ATP-binding protein [Trueperaceae bacterium]
MHDILKYMFKRSIRLPASGTETFFLWGPRQTGKTTLLKQAYPDARWVDLLRSEEYRRYLQNPELLRQELAAEPVDQVVIDEIQKVPALLDEVHWLIENSPVHFALSGSSARKVRRGAANLLGGRAIRRELFGLTATELGGEFDLGRLLNRGYLPRIYLSKNPRQLLDAYVSDYLREEIAAEAVVRNVPAFADFLTSAALGDTEQINFSNIAREAGVSSHTVKSYYEILVDTLLGRWLPAYSRRPKRRVVTAPKFYFADVGVVNHLARRGTLLPRSELFGKAFENWVLHELVACNSYSEAYADISYWRLSTGVEVDFIINDMDVAIEAKATHRVTDHHLKGLRELAKDHPGMRQRVVVSLEPRARRTEDGILIVAPSEFVQRLGSGEFFA